MSAATMNLNYALVKLVHVITFHEPNFDFFISATLSNHLIRLLTMSRALP